MSTPLRLLASHYMIAIAYHVTLEETEVGEAAFGSVLVPWRLPWRILAVFLSFFCEMNIGAQALKIVDMR